MEITKELCRDIVALKQQSMNSDQDNFLNLVKKVAHEYGVTYTVLLKMIYDKDFLFSQLNPEMERLGSEIEAITLEINHLEEQLTLLQEYKNFIGSTICDVYGHTLEVSPDGNTLQCNICGMKPVLEYDDTIDNQVKTR